MVTIDWGTAIVGIITGIISTLIFIWIIKPRKKKIDLHNLKKLVSDNGVKAKEIFDAFKELEDIFKEMEVK